MQVFFLLMIVITLISAWNAAQEILIAKQLRQSGVLIDAVVVESGKQWSKRGGGPYLVYEFTPSGQAEGIKHRQGISLMYQIKLEKEATRTVTVSYLPDKPKISRLAGLDMDNSDLNASIANTVIFVVLLIAIRVILF
jgi:hypothetical protein